MVKRGDFLSNILSFLEMIGNFILLPFTLLHHFLQDLIFAVKAIGLFIVNIPAYLNWIPPELYSYVAILVSVAVIYKILGRD